MWITQRFRTIAVFPINWERLDAGVFTSMLSRPQVDLTFERFRFLAPCQRLRAIVCVLSAHLRRVLKSTCVCLRLREQCLRSEMTSVARVANVLLLRFVAGNMDVNTPAFKRSQLIGNTAIVRKRCVIHTNSTCVCWRLSVATFTQKRKDASFDLWPPLLATKRKSRTSATRETDVISERKHCSRKRRHTQVDFRTWRKCADKTKTIARKRWHGARKRKRSNVRSTCGRL